MDLLHHERDKVNDALAIVANAAPDSIPVSSTLRERVTRKLFPNHWIRALATNASQATPDEVERLLALVERRHALTSKAHLTAVELIGEARLTNSQCDRAAAACARWLRSRNALHATCPIVRWGFLCSLVGIVSLVPYYCCWDFGHPGLWDNLYVFTIVTACVMTITYPFQVIATVEQWNRARIAYAGTLGRLKSPLAVGPLLIASTSVVSGLRMVGQATLTALLTSLDLRAIPELSGLETRACYRLLGCSRERLVLALLNLLEQRGDGSACQPVLALIRRTRSEAVRERAIAVHQILEARLREAQNESLLLRASLPSASSDTLLRAGLAASVPAEELLRPCNTDRTYAVVGSVNVGLAR
jgi:hypothetical protein